MEQEMLFQEYDGILIGSVGRDVTDIQEGFTKVHQVTQICTKIHQVAVTCTKLQSVSVGKCLLSVVLKEEYLWFSDDGDAMTDWMCRVGQAVTAGYWRFGVMRWWCDARCDSDGQVDGGGGGIQDAAEAALPAACQLRIITQFDIQRGRQQETGIVTNLAAPPILQQVAHQPQHSSTSIWSSSFSLVRLKMSL